MELITAYIKYLFDNMRIFILSIYTYNDSTKESISNSKKFILAPSKKDAWNAWIRDRGDFALKDYFARNPEAYTFSMIEVPLITNINGLEKLAC